LHVLAGRSTERTVARAATFAGRAISIARTAMIAGIVLAAGRSSRMGEPKALLVYAGATFLQRAVRALRDGGCGRVIVVMGAPTDPAAASIAAQARKLDADVAVNDAAHSEQVDSLRAGLLAVAADADAVVVLPVDVPAVDARAVRAVVDAFAARGAPVVRASFDGRNGHPVLFSRALFAELLGGDLPEGARTVIHRHAAASEGVAVPDAGVVADVDTPDDYRRLLAEQDGAAGGAPSHARGGRGGG
jgi:molybdenum cofactor cytidylyltransferase